MSDADAKTRALAIAPRTLGEGRYEVRQLLGSGGMGVVVCARDGLLHRDVAIKLLADNLALDDEARERFAREARAAAMLTDPHVVTIHDVGEEGDRPYLVMEFVDGGSLSDALHTRGPLPAAEVVDIARQTLAGLDRAHRAGLLHRDLKPANLLRGADGVVKVTDFGVAQAAGSEAMTRTGIVVGTLAYLAPERMTGAEATPQTDLYALGATLLELLTGSPPDHRQGMDGAPLHGSAGLPDDTPEGLAALIGRCLAREPQARPASAAAAIALLDGDVERTRPLTAAATVAMPRVDGDAPTAVHPVDGDAAAARTSAIERTVAVPTDDAPDPATVTPVPGVAPDWVTSLTPDRLAGLLIGLIVFIAIVLAVVLGASADDPADPAADDAAAPAADEAAEVDAATVPRGDTPEDTARNLAAWLRDLGG
jgi:eukaryotic-like serine/threonine-protein kinase